MLKTCGTEHLSISVFKMQVYALSPGESVVYAVGDIARDRVLGRINQEPYTDELVGLADMARRMFERDEVALTQRRLGQGKFEYRATKLTPVRRR